MIRDEDLKYYLAAITQSLAGPVMNDLQSEPVKELAGIILILLGKIQSDLTANDDIESAAIPEWGALRSAAEQFIPPVDNAKTSSHAGGLRALDRQLSDIQSALADRKIFERFVAQLSDKRDGATRWLNNMTVMLVNLARAFEDNANKASTAAAVESAGDRVSDLKQRLGAYLVQHYPTLPTEPIEKFAVVSGGYSKLSALLTLKANNHLPQHLALRLDIPKSSTPMQLAVEYPILQRVYKLGLPVPEPILFEPNAVHIGGAFVLSMQIMDARLAGSPFVEDRRKFGANTAPNFGREAAKLLARLHGLTYDASATDVAVAHERDQMLAELSEEWRGMAKTPFSLQRDLAIAWLHANLMKMGRPMCLVHGDFAQHNILVRDGQIAAVLDWELAKIGDPAEDLAQCKMMLIGDIISWEEFVQIYLENGGPASACDPHALAYYAVLLFLKHGVYQTKIRNRFVGGEGGDIKDAFISAHIVDRVSLYQGVALSNATMLDID